MHKYLFNVKINKGDNNAGTKATEDCKTILLENGFIDIEVSFIKAWYLLPLNLVKLFSIFVYYIIIIKPKSLIFVQYPLLGINSFFKYFIKLLKLKGCKFSCIIHDIDSLRSDYDKKKIEMEIDALSAYDAVISHNDSMSRWLKKNSYSGFITEILLFDYLVTINGEKDCEYDKEKMQIAFAGALGRGNFLEKMADIEIPFYLNLYGSGYKKNILGKNENIKWYGSFSPNQVVDKICDDYGLIWDGESIEDITGLMGNYLKYNTPHKTSLYLASGIPVIIPKKAALAEFVALNNIGVCINSISTLSEEIIDVNSETYSSMRENARLIGEKLKRGYFLSNALNKTLNYFDNKI